LSTCERNADSTCTRGQRDVITEDISASKRKRKSASKRKSATERNSIARVSPPCPAAASLLAVVALFGRSGSNTTFPVLQQHRRISFSLFDFPRVRGGIGSDMRAGEKPGNKSSSAQASSSPNGLQDEHAEFFEKLRAEAALAEFRAPLPEDIVVVPDDEEDARCAIAATPNGGCAYFSPAGRGGGGREEHAPLNLTQVHRWDDQIDILHNRCVHVVCEAAAVLQGKWQFFPGSSGRFYGAQLQVLNLLALRVQKYKY
jgi:hypothetical protein